ncbi:30S ribosomal protein S6 [Blastocystis sp. subtype 4]|uniref:30S ribosomal protein S6 n=1 Tax=Blastocystis sp. subtype 4 TaxID=944170 RepID=UPI000711A9F3|nr:30S ribosomal protein S6 [Blastocystis sp. subtype 4]KNB46472.1 30S ribosomal protein S6 [Blastocystis sp. subtype 4]|eukprot:XP_014529902.1 30S ribosomal protein S6 [Blastocystis sp. subtype 4]
MPFYRILLVTRNDLAVASLYNKFVETAKYVINNGGVFQRIYNTGNQIFRYPLYCKANSKTYREGPMFSLQFCSSPQVMESVCENLKNSTYYLRIEKEKINTTAGMRL